MKKFFSKFSCFASGTGGKNSEYKETAIPGVVRLPTGKLKMVHHHHHGGDEQHGVEQFEFLSLYANDSGFGTPISCDGRMVSGSSYFDVISEPESPGLVNRLPSDSTRDPVGRFTVIRSHTKFVNGVRYHPYSSNFGYLNYFTDPIIVGSSPFDFCVYDEIERELKMWVLSRYQQVGDKGEIVTGDGHGTPTGPPLRENLPQTILDRIIEIEKLCDDELVVEPMDKLEKLRIELSIGGSEFSNMSESERYGYLDFLVLDETMHRLRWKYPRVRNVVGLIEKIPTDPRGGSGGKKERKVSSDRQISSDAQSSSVYSGLPGMTDNDGWIFEVHGPIDVWTKQEVDGSLSVRCRSVQSQALFNAISLIYEIDLHTQFMPHLAKSIKLESIPGCGQRANFLLRYIYKLPIPFANRDIVLFAFGCNAISLDGVKGIIISAESIPNGQESWWGKNVPPEGADRTVRENVRGMNFIMKPLPGGKTELTVIANLDKQLALVPKSIVNWMIKDMIKGLYKNMIKLNTKFPQTEFAKRVDTNPEFYHWVKGIILQHNLE
jgi:hypothetical protein